jgi:hypothetical protein
MILVTTRTRGLSLRAADIGFAADVNSEGSAFLALGSSAPLGNNTRRQSRSPAKLVRKGRKLE